MKTIKEFLDMIVAFTVVAVGLLSLLFIVFATIRIAIWMFYRIF
jgi:hypothetical protein